MVMILGVVVLIGINFCGLIIEVNDFIRGDIVVYVYECFELLVWLG